VGRQVAELRENVDVLISDGRIAGVAPRGAVAADVTVIDAPTGTVMPGLIDMHTHRQMQGYGYGDREGRLWLSLGVTTTRSPGGPAYHTVEDQEAIESGKRSARATTPPARRSTARGSSTTSCGRSPSPARWRWR
jgi:imidazolonepropionase-like amidohydrolase